LGRDYTDFIVGRMDTIRNVRLARAKGKSKRYGGETRHQEICRQNDVRARSKSKGAIHDQPCDKKEGCQAACQQGWITPVGTDRFSNPEPQ